MKKYFITGLLFWIPVWAVYIVMSFIFEIFDSSLSLLPTQYQPTTWLGFNLPGLGFIFTLLLVWATGVLTANFLGNWLISWWDRLLNKIPLVRSIYSTAQQLINALIKSKEASFRQVVLVEYPRSNSWSIGFLTGPAEYLDQKDLISVFIPTTPNPTSGFLIYVPETDVKKLNISVEEAFRMIVSLGVVQPEKKKNTHQL